MRDLKFRVWDKINKEWLIYKDCNVGWLAGMTGQKTLADDPPRPNMMKMYCSPDGSTFNDLQFCIDSDDFEVVQYIGRKDKNGIEVFEGDLVRCSMSFEGGTLPHAGVIVYDETFGAFGTKNETGTTLLHNHCLHTLEVTGNIYES